MRKALIPAMDLAMPAQGTAYMCLRRRYQRNRAGSIQEAAGNSWSWTGRQTDFQSRSAFWWTKTGADSSDGNVEEAKAVASG